MYLLLRVPSAPSMSKPAASFGGGRRGISRPSTLLAAHSAVFIVVSMSGRGDMTADSAAAAGRARAGDGQYHQHFFHISSLLPARYKLIILMS